MADLYALTIRSGIIAPHRSFYPRIAPHGEFICCPLRLDRPTNLYPVPSKLARFSLQAAASGTSCVHRYSVREDGWSGYLLDDEGVSVSLLWGAVGPQQRVRLGFLEETGSARCGYRGAAFRSFDCLEQIGS